MIGTERERIQKTRRLVLGTTVLVASALFVATLLAMPLLTATPPSAGGVVAVSKAPLAKGTHTTLTSPNSLANGYFGDSVAIGGSLALVGAPFETAGGFLDAGHAYLFNASTGALIHILNSSSAQSSGEFGYSVALSGQLALVAAPGETAGGFSQAGHVYVFNARTGALTRTLTSPNVQSGGGFGVSVGLSGTLAIVGAPDETAGGSIGAGHVYVFNASSGARIQSLTSSNAQTYGYFGQSVAVSGKLAIAGAPEENASGYTDSGRAYVFNARSGAPIQNLTSPNPVSGTVGLGFGYSVALNGQLAVVGAPDETVGGYAEAGHAYVFNANTGAVIQTLASPNAQGYGYFGYSVAVSGKLVLVGSPDETAGGYTYAGHVYVLNAHSGKLVRTLTSPNAQSGGGFGESVAVSGKVAVEGAPYETAHGHSAAGHAYVLRA